MAGHLGATTTVKGGADTLEFGGTGAEQEDVGTGKGGDDVEVFQDAGFHRIGGGVDDQAIVDIDGGTSLLEVIGGSAFRTMADRASDHRLGPFPHRDATHQG